MINKIYAKSDIPNKEGYKFYAVLEDGTVLEDIVIKKDNGLHSCTYFKQMIGWLIAK